MKARPLRLHLPPGYHAQPDPDVLILRGADGSVVGRFSGRGFVAEEVEQAAWEDYGKVEGPSSNCVPTPVVTLFLALAFFLGCLARMSPPQ